jgi:hypothetical protein
VTSRAAFTPFPASRAHHFHQRGPTALVEVTNFGTNPTNLRMYLYVPDRLAARPPS